jgi:hypothetical protein
MGKDQPPGEGATSAVGLINLRIVLVGQLSAVARIKDRRFRLKTSGVAGKTAFGESNDTRCAIPPPGREGQDEGGQNPAANGANMQLRRSALFWSQSPVGKSGSLILPRLRNFPSAGKVNCINNWVNLE